jgi:hypothetical protein
MTPTHPTCITPYWILKKTEEAAGLRFCNGECKTLIPLSKFKNKQKSRNLCHECYKRSCKAYFNTRFRLAYNSLICRARSDTPLFNQKKINITIAELLVMATPAQIEDFSAWAIVPKKPSETVSKENSVLILSYQRMYLINRWKNH